MFGRNRATCIFAVCEKRSAVVNVASVPWRSLLVLALLCSWTDGHPTFYGHHQTTPQTLQRWPAHRRPRPASLDLDQGQRVQHRSQDSAPTHNDPDAESLPGPRTAAYEGSLASLTGDNRRMGLDSPSIKQFPQVTWKPAGKVLTRAARSAAGADSPQENLSSLRSLNLSRSMSLLADEDLGNNRRDFSSGAVLGQNDNEKNGGISAKSDGTLGRFIRQAPQPDDRETADGLFTATTQFPVSQRSFLTAHPEEGAWRDFPVGDVHVQDHHRRRSRSLLGRHDDPVRAAWDSDADLRQGRPEQGRTVTDESDLDGVDRPHLDLADSPRHTRQRAGHSEGPGAGVAEDGDLTGPDHVHANDDGQSGGGGYGDVYDGEEDEVEEEGEGQAPCHSQEQGRMGYLTELYQRMAHNAASHNPGPWGAPDQPEKITALKPLRHTGSHDHRHWQTFNISEVNVEDNITGAFLAVFTENLRNSCRTEVKESRNGTLFDCQRSPFGIGSMATFDVTAHLIGRLRQRHSSHFRAFVRRVRRLLETILVVFIGVDPEELGHNEPPLPCASPELRRTRRAIEAALSARQSQSEAGELSLVSREHDASKRSRSQRANPEAVVGAKESTDMSSYGELSYQTAQIRNTEGRPPVRNVLKIVREDPAWTRNSSLRATRRAVLLPVDADLVNASLTGTLRARPRRLRRGSERKRRDAGRVGQPCRLSPNADLAQHRHGAGNLHRPLRRRKRSYQCLNSTGRDMSHFPENQNSCAVDRFEVSFMEDLNMDSVIFPHAVLDIGRCVGRCSATLTPRNRVPSRSHVVSLLYQRGGGPIGVPRPSCRPTRFADECIMRLLNDAIVIEKWHNARVTECNCI